MDSWRTREPSDTQSRRGRGRGGVIRGGRAFNFHTSFANHGDGRPQSQFETGMGNGRGGWSGGRGRGARGDWRGGGTGTWRGGRSEGWRPAWERNIDKTVQPPIPEPPLGHLLFSLDMVGIEEEAERYKPFSAITNCRTVASYNWLDDTGSTIIVPGMPQQILCSPPTDKVTGKPARWTPLSKPRQLQPDVGEFFRDPNAAHYPKHPIEPGVLAVLAMDRKASRDVDVVACGSTIGNLLRFISGEDKQFRILVESVQGTVFLIRRENSPREIIPGVQGYGHSFPDAYTTWDGDVKGSSSHQRMISYQFGGLQILLRFEADGCLVDENNDFGHLEQFLLPGSHAENPIAKTTAQLDRGQPPVNSDLKLVSGGEVVEQKRIFELKTRSFRKKEVEMFEDTFSDQLPRLWIAQIPIFILAYHTHGLFEDISVRDAKSDVDKWEKEHVNDLSRLAALIHKIIDLVRSRPDEKLELRHAVAGSLEVREQLADAGDALSDVARISWAKERGMTDGVASEREHFGRSEDINHGQDDDDEGDEFGWDERSEPDFTACSADGCGYCGRCSY